ncbi:MAG: ABC transporter permease subunit [Ornithinimicrobium sp.]
MPLLLVFVKELRDRLVLVCMTSAVLILLCIATGALWEPMSVQFASLRELLPPAVLALIPGGDMSTTTGWINAQVMSLTAPGALIVVAILSAVRSTVGEEDRGTLAMLLGNGVSRVTFAAAKLGAMLAHVLLTGAVLTAGLLAATTVWALDVPPSHLFAAGAHAVTLGWFFGAVCLAIGLSTGRFRLTAMLSATIAATSFVVATFFPLSDALSGWERVSPWYYFSAADPLNNGVQYGYLIVLWGVSMTLFILSLWLFVRRDLKI